MVTTEERKTKYRLLLELLEEGLIMMHIDARHSHIIVPAYLKDDPHLRLNLSYRFDVPDLDIDEARIQVTLSFQGTPFLCVLPLDAIWGISQPPAPGIHLFPDCIPPEILLQLLGEQLFEDEDLDTLQAFLQAKQESQSRELPAVAPQAATLAIAEVDEEAPLEPIDDIETRANDDNDTPGLRLVVDNTETPSSDALPEESDTAEELSAAERRALFRVVPTPDDDQDQ